MIIPYIPIPSGPGSHPSTFPSEFSHSVTSYKCNLQCLFLCIWLNSCIIIFSEFIHVVACIRTSFLFIAKQIPLCAYTTFKKINWRIITLHIVKVSAIHQHESATAYTCPLPLKPPSSSHPSRLWHSIGFRFPASYSKFSLVIYFIFGNVYVSIPLS